MQPVTGSLQGQAYHEICTRVKLGAMMKSSKHSLFLVASLTLAPFIVTAQRSGDVGSKIAPEYTTDGRLKLPEHYREWIWLSSDFLTASDPANMQGGEHRLFNNLFVDPEAYKAFLQTGTWPDKTMLVVEQREAEDMGPNPNHKGTAQGSVIGLDFHVKDEAHFSGKWAFFDFKGSSTASMIPLTARCYSCHASRAAVDTTFVQFYPTLLPIAKSKATLSPAYLGEGESVPPAMK
jgi:hypothetical protein